VVCRVLLHIPWCSWMNICRYSLTKYLPRAGAGRSGFQSCSPRCPGQTFCRRASVRTILYMFCRFSASRPQDYLDVPAIPSVTPYCSRPGLALVVYASVQLYLRRSRKENVGQLLESVFLPGTLRRMPHVAFPNITSGCRHPPSVRKPYCCPTSASPGWATSLRYCGHATVYCGDNLRWGSCATAGANTCIEWTVQGRTTPFVGALELTNL